MIKVVKERPVDNKELFVGTHNGIFHCDEVVGIAILLIANSSRACYVVRTRNIDEQEDG